MTTTSPTRPSPIHQILKSHHPQWRTTAGALFAWRYQKDDGEQRAMRDLGLCDLSPLAKLGVRGPAAAAWLQDQGIAAFDSIYDAQRLADGGWGVRTGANDFFFESGSECHVLAALDEALGRGTPEVVRVERQEATFLLTGSKTPELFAQTCAIDFREAVPGRVLMTRVAGVNCVILPEGTREVPRYRIWVDASYAVSLWEMLYEICHELGGQLIGAEAAGGLG